MVRKVKKLISIILAVAFIMSGTLILPPQGLAGTGNTISGTISLPAGRTAPAGGIAGSINVSSDTGGEYYHAIYNIPAGSRSTAYTVTIPAASNSDYIVRYNFNNSYPGYVGNGYYSTSGTTAEYDSATPINFNNGNVSGINLSVYAGNTISGTISLPVGKSAPAGGLEGDISVSSNNSDEYYFAHFNIPAGYRASNYTVTVPEEASPTEYRVYYYFYDTYPGYIDGGYYSTSGTTPDYSSATLVSTSQGNINGINLTIYTGHTISGTITLSSGVAPDGGLEGNIDIYVQDDEGNYNTYFEIAEGEDSVNYTVSVPADASECRVSYYLNNNVSGFVNNGHYSTEGTTADYDAATLIDASSGNISDIDLTIYSGNIISGTIALPAGVSAPDGGLEGNIEIHPQGSGFYETYFEIAEGSNSTSYTVTVPTDVVQCRVGYYLYDNVSEYLREGYYTSGGTTADYDSATFVNVGSQQAAEVDLTILTRTVVPDDHGDTIVTATQVSIGANINGRIDPPGDVDYFRFTPNHTGSYEFTTISNEDTYGYLFDAQGNEITYSDDDGEGNNFLITEDLQAGQDYYIKVKMYDSGNTGNYQLSITELTTTPVPVESVSLNQSNLSLAIGQTANLVATILPDNATDKSVTWIVSSQSGSNIATVSDTGVVTALNPGTALIRAISNSDTSKYAEVDVSVVTPDDHSNTIDSATPLSIGTNEPGQIDPQGDVDYFKFTPDYSGAYCFTTIANYDTYGYLFDAQQNQLGADDDSGDGGNFLINQDLQAGQDYYIKVRMYSSTETGNYQLSVREVFASTISGTISLPEGKTAPDGGIGGYVYFSSQNGGYNNSVYFSIPEGSNSVEYAQNVHWGTQGTDYYVSYGLDNNYSGYAEGGYYSAGGTTASHASATLVDLSGGNASGIDLTLIETHSISGIISLPEGMTAPAGGIVGSINMTSGNSTYSTSFNIPEGERSVSYTRDLPPLNNKYTVNYGLNNYYSGYLGYGYYSTNGTTVSNSNAAALFDVNEDADGVNLTVLTGTVISGIISLPEGTPVSDEVIEGQISIESQNGEIRFQKYFSIPVSGNHASYSATVPADVSITGYRVGYYLYDNYDYLREGYYSVNGTTNLNSATWINPQQGNQTDINLTILTGQTISGTFSLPDGVSAPAGGIAGGINIWPAGIGRNYYIHFNIPEGESSASYSVHVPADSSIAGYHVSYFLYKTIGNYVREGYYSPTGSTTYNLAALVSVNEGNASNINLTPLIGNTISGTVSLPNGDVAPAAGIHGSVYVALPSNTESGGGGGGGGGPAPASIERNLNGTNEIGVRGAADNDDDYYYYADFDILPGQNSASYTTDAIPVDATISGYRVRYNIYDHPEYVDEGYYSTAGTTTSESATLVSVNSGSVSNVNLTILAGHTITGTISLPNNARVVDRGISGELYFDPQNGGNGYYTGFYLPVGSSSADYSVTLPPIASTSGYLVNYDIYDYPGYVDEGYYSSSGTTTSKFATPVNVNEANATDINLTLLTGNTISGTISLPPGVTAPAGGIEVAVNVDPMDGGNPYTTYLYIPRGLNSERYTITVPVDTSITGYRVSYQLEDNYSGYLEEGYYSTSGTTTSNLATLVNVNNGNVSPIDLTLLTGNTLPSSISLNKATVTLAAGQTEQLIATVIPANATDKSVTWTVSGESGSNIATVSDTGLVRAVNVGTAVIRATSNADATKYAECAVTVTAAGDKSDLRTAIDLAQNKLDGATEGTDLGQYPVGSKAILQAAITTAQAVADNQAATSAQIAQAETSLTNAIQAFEAGRVLATGFSATPIAELGVNPNDNNSAGMFIGLENIKDSENIVQEGSKIAGYEIEVHFDPSQVSIPYAVDETSSGALFVQRVNTENGIGTVLVTCATGGEITNFNRLFFIPITLKGSAHDQTALSVKYHEVCDLNLNTIEIPSLQNLKFQRGKVFNQNLVNSNPNIGDAVAGLQYLAKGLDGGFELDKVNPVNMASIIETEPNLNTTKTNIKDIIALMQYTVRLRDDHFQPINIVPGKLDFGLKITNGTSIGKRLEISANDLENGDLVQVLKGSDGSNVINPVTVQETGTEPLILDNINLGGELFLKVQITRGNLVGQQLIFDNLEVSMSGIGAANTTDITVSGLQTGDQVSLYREDETQIGSSLTVDQESLKVTFNDVSIANSGIRVQINRPDPESSTPSIFFFWNDIRVIPPIPPTDATEPPVVTGTVRAGDTIISGTAPIAASVVLSVNGAAMLPITTDMDGNWTAVTAIPLVQGDVISVTAQSAGKLVSSPTLVTVSGPSTTPVASITVNSPGNATSVQEGSTLAMSAAVLPATATDKTIIWSVATLLGGTAAIDPETGVLIGLEPGTVTVTATNAASGVTGTKVITITPNPHLNLTSTAFVDGGTIPNAHILSGADNGYTVSGAINKSIPLNWGTAAPAGHSFFIIMTDIDADNWNHWVVKNIPNTVTSINPGASSTCDQPGTMPGGSVELLTSWGSFDGFTNGYYGPKPPQGTGTHHYTIEVFELDTTNINTSDEGYGYTYEQLRQKIDSHIIKSGQITGKYIAP